MLLTPEESIQIQVSKTVVYIKIAFRHSYNEYGNELYYMRSFDWAYMKSLQQQIFLLFFWNLIIY